MLPIYENFWENQLKSFWYNAQNSWENQYIGSQNINWLSHNETAYIYIQLTNTE